MAKKKLKIKRNGNGAYQKLVNPLQQAHGDVVKMTSKVTNPPKAIKDLVGDWPFDKK